MKQIKSYKEYQSTIAEGNLFVRFTPSIKDDLRYKSSQNAITGRSEAGLSVNPAEYLEYSFLMLGGYKCYLLSGEIVGRGGDNEPLLKNFKVVAEVNKKVIDEATEAKEQAREEKIRSAIIATTNERHPDHWMFKSCAGALMRLRHHLRVWPEDIRKVARKMGLEDRL